MKKKPWQEKLENSIANAADLCNDLHLPKEDYGKYERIISQFPIMITPYYFSLINPDDPNDPIARMCIPSAEELNAEGTFDTSGEQSNTMQEGVQHKYSQTALILSTNVCAMYCRHCFRKRLVGLSDAELNNQVPLQEGVRIVDGAKALQNGLGKSVRYVMSHPLGKIEILGETEPGRMLFKFHQNKYPEDASRIFTADIAEETTWLDESLREA